MKKILFIILLLNLKVNSQELVGNWKVISYEDEISYFNKITDSISYKDTSRQGEADSFRKMSELIIFPITYNFESNGGYAMIHPMLGKISGQFKLNQGNKTIILTDEKGKKDELPFIYKDEILFVEMKMETGYIEIGLKKN